MTMVIVDPRWAFLLKSAEVILGLADKEAMACDLSGGQRVEPWP